ncbi:MAG: class I SAM-dependent methyltransferase [Acidimicrobiales bacterium]
MRLSRRIERRFWDVQSRTWDEVCTLPGRAVTFQTVVAAVASHASTPDFLVLDVGCGTGSYALAVAAAGIRVVGVDLSGRMVARAEEKAAALGLARLASFVEGDVTERGALPTAPFDAALCIYTLHRLRDRHSFLLGLRTVLRDHGLLVVASPTQGRACAPRPVSRGPAEAWFWRMKSLLNRLTPVPSREALLRDLADTGYQVVTTLPWPRGWAVLATVRPVSGDTLSAGGSEPPERPRTAPTTPPPDALRHSRDTRD